MIWVTIGGALICAALLSFAVSNKLKVREYSVSSTKLSRSFTAVHISDLHESCFGVGQSTLLGAVRDVKPDVILITGDMIEDDRRDASRENAFGAENPSRVLLTSLVKIAPCYMVLGNHEANIPNISALCDELCGMGIHLLHPRESEDFLGGEVLICGICDPYFGRSEVHHNNLKERFAEDKATVSPMLLKWRENLTRECADIAAEKRFTLLLSHRPEEFLIYHSLGFDAAFSGHAHGGQWRLPPLLNGVYAPHQGLFPSHAGGCYKYDGFTHVVSRGLSKKRMVRIFNRPEICVVDFEMEENSCEKTDD